MMSNDRHSGTSKARNLDMRPLIIMVAVVAFMWAFAPALRAAQPVRHLRPVKSEVFVMGNIALLFVKVRTKLPFSLSKSGQESNKVNAFANLSNILHRFSLKMITFAT